MKLSCASCGSPFEAVRLTAKFCSPRCNKRAQRGQLVTPIPAAVLVEPTRTGLSDAVRAELEAVGRLETSLGQAALVLAQRIEGVRESGSAVASLTREMRATLVEATKGAKAQESKLESYRDELAARRRA